ncbi:DUF1800 domain-containing protein [Muricoccus radiodurans]|uniref:DUF1800 domain-containing protein n=1 Tax=Muricoccus radiodurans TaxID=2231721 RepID=UPI003CE7AF45
MDAARHIAELRFGLGPRPDLPAPEDVPAWLLAQLASPDDPGPPPRDWEAYPTTWDGLAIRAADARTARMPNPPPSRQAALFAAEAQAFHAHLVTTSAPFRERLVLFWTNHLTVSRREGGVTGLTGAYVREAIRPHVTGRFAAMLKAAVRHPAMLLYLNQSASVGPDSAFGARARRGLNENLAREVLELHTLSPEAGYTQADVTEFARLLTGLSTELRREPYGTVFRPEMHEPGGKIVMGRIFPPGEAAIDAALEWLAEHPATQRHLARKLARHFVADEPPAAAVEALFGVLRDTGTDLGAAARTLVELPAAWHAPLSKLRSPVELITAAFRAVGAGPEIGEMAFGSVTSLGQPLWTAPAPIGWPDVASAWANPEGMVQRLDRVHAISGRFARQDSKATLELVLGPLASPETRRAVERAGSNRDALTLLLGSPEFQRR